MYILMPFYLDGDFVIAPLACSLQVQLSVAGTSQGVWPGQHLKQVRQFRAHLGSLDLILEPAGDFNLGG